jgi:hypothetical protein
MYERLTKHHNKVIIFMHLLVFYADTGEKWFGIVPRECSRRLTGLRKNSQQPETGFQSTVRLNEVIIFKNLHKFNHIA